MRQRTRYNYTDEDYKNLYTGYDTNRWYDHIYRVAISNEMLQQYIWRHGINTLADLSAGDGRITSTLANVNMFLGDFSVENVAAHGYMFSGRIEETILQVNGVDLFVLSETIEHVEDPDALLNLIAERANHLFLTTPLNEQLDINPEHLWVWGKEDIETMLRKAGFQTTEFYSELDFGVSRFQIWMVRK